MKPTIKPTRQLAKLRPDLLYHPWQVDGIRMGARMGSFMLNDDMGLGKSIQALTVAAILHDKGVAKRILIGCPGGLVGNWQEELEKNTLFTSIGLNGDVTAKQQEKLLKEYEAGEADILVASYDMLVKHQAWFHAFPWDVAIYDECHQLKERTSLRSRAIIGRQEDNWTGIPARWNMMLTGSPILNNVLDLWTLLHKVDPVRFPNFWVFRNRYAVFGGYKGKQCVGVKNEAELHSLLADYMIRREKSEVGITDPIITPIYLELTKLQRKLYDQVFEEEILDVPGLDDPLELDNALVKFGKLKMICGTTATIEGYEDSSTKLDWMMGRVGEILYDDQEPVVIFTQFRGVLAAAEERMRKKGWDPLVLHGDVPQADRAPLVKEWREDSLQREMHRPLLSMYQVGGVGLNMTAAHQVIRLDKLFVPKLNDQAVDRVNRLGRDTTKGPVRVWDPICRGTIEKRIERINETKARIFASVVDGQEDPTWKRRLVMAVLGTDEEEED